MIHQRKKEDSAKKVWQFFLLNSNWNKKCAVTSIILTIVASEKFTYVQNTQMFRCWYLKRKENVDSRQVMFFFFEENSQVVRVIIKNFCLVRKLGEKEPNNGNMLIFSVSDPDPDQGRQK